MFRKIAISLLILFGSISIAHASLGSDTRATTKTISSATYKTMVKQAKSLAAKKQHLTESAIRTALAGKKFIGRTGDGTNFTLTYAKSKLYRVVTNGASLTRYWTLSSNKFCAGTSAKLAAKTCTDRIYKVPGGYVFLQNNKVANVIVTR